MKTFKYILTAVFLGATLLAQSQVLPEIELGAKAVVSGNINMDDAGAASAVADFSDSQILLGFRQKLYSNWRGQMVFGMQFPDADSDLGQVFFNHVFVQVENQKNIFKLGRSTTQTIINEFPTLRDDDALYFTYALNPFSVGANTQDNQYGNVLEYTHIFDQRYWFTIHAENYADLSNPTSFKLNGLGGSFLYIVPETQVWNRNILQRAGFSYNSYLTDRPGYTGYAQALKEMLGALTFNVHPDPVNFVDLRIQGIYNIGFSEIDSLNTYEEYVRSPSVYFYSSVRYLRRKLERPKFQTSAGFGYRSFSQVDASNQWIGIFNMFYRLGENFDFGFQYRYQHNKGQSGLLFGNAAHRFQLTLVYTIDHVFNSQFDDRNSLLNLEHGYMK